MMNETHNMTWILPPLSTVTVPINSIWNFITLDYKNYFMHPFITVFTAGNEYFWNFFLKTLLFGELATWVSWHMLESARIIGILLLVMLVYSGATILVRLVSKKAWSEDMVLPLVITVFLIAGLMYFRFRYPTVAGMVGPANNARYIYNIILPLTILFVKAIEWHTWNGRKLIATVGIVTGISFATLSLTFQAVHAYTMFESFPR